MQRRHLHSAVVVEQALCAMMASVVRDRLPFLRTLRWSIRLRSALVSAIVVALSLGIGGTALVGFVYASASATVQSGAEDRLRDLTAALAQTSPDQIDPMLLSTDRTVVVVQILDDNGTVVRASTGAPNTRIDSANANANGDGDDRGGPPRGRRDDHAQLDSASVDSSAGTFTVLVGAGDGDADATITTVAVLLAILAPIITAIAGGATYYLVGRSLRSMEQLRQRVSEITAADLSERVPVSKRHDEITALAETMNDMLGRIEVGQESQRRFVSDASHELRSPLATIAGVLELGREDPRSIDVEVLDGTLIPEVLRVQRLVEDLLVLARADEGGLELRNEDVDLDDIAGNEARLLRTQCTHSVVVGLNPTRVHGDPSALTRVLRNLTVNAARHANSVVEIGVHHDDKWAYLEVGDDGPGIAIEERDRVFERFVRLEEHRARGQGGSGLGLAIVTEIVAAHGGDVAIGERDSGGTTVTVRLPYAPDE